MSTYAQWVLRTQSSDLEIVLRAARNPKCPLDLLRKINYRMHWRVCKALTQNPVCPGDILLELIKGESHEYSILKGLVVAHPNCPRETLLLLSKEEYSLSYVLGNPNCPTEIIVESLNHAKSYIRAAAALRV